MVSYRIIFLLFLLFHYQSFIFGQTLTGVFDMDRGKIISNNTLVLACTTCNGFSNNSIVFYEQKGNEWIATDSIRISDYVEGLNIADMAVSHAGNAVSISLEKSFINNHYEDDAILVLRKVNHDWHVAMKLDSILLTRSFPRATYMPDFSKDGETLVITNSNSFPRSSGITTKTYSFNEQGTIYELSQELHVPIYSSARLTLNLLDNDRLIAIGIEDVRTNPNDKFIMYSLENGLWQRDYSFNETNDYPSYASLICSDATADRIAVAKYRVADGEQPKVTFYERNGSTQEWETILDPYFSNETFDAPSITMSDRGDLFAVGFIGDERFLEMDTTSYVDLLKLSDQEGIELLHRFTFETGDNTNKYGMTGLVELSDDGKVLMINKGLHQRYVYSLTDLIQSNSEVDMEIESLVFPNPTTGQVFIKDHAFESIILLNSTGQYLKEFESREFEISDYPNGIYYLLFKYADKNPAGVKLIKLE